jgi:hypothetical protein
MQMSKYFTKYISFLGVLLLVNTSSLYANSAYNVFSLLKTKKGIEIKIPSKNLDECALVNSSIQDYQNKSFFNVVEVQQEEIEETSDHEKIDAVNSFTSGLINTELYNRLSLQNKKNKYYNKTFVYASSTKLHIRFQVFII